MDVHLAQELLNELGASLENLETQQAALLLLLKDNGVVTDEQLAPYLGQAGNASNVRWRAAHLRLEHVFSAAEQKEQQEAKQREEEQPTGTQAHPEKEGGEARKADKAAAKGAHPKE